MTQQNLLTNSFKFVAKDLVGNVLFWPVWWYSKGLALVFRYTIKSVSEQERRIGLRLWFLNLFKPMFGQYDWQGRLISFFMRLVMMIFKIMMFLVWILLMIIFLIVWVAGPVVVIYQIGRYFMS